MFSECEQACENNKCVNTWGDSSPHRKWCIQVHRGHGSHLLTSPLWVWQTLSSTSSEWLLSFSVTRPLLFTKDKGLSIDDLSLFTCTPFSDCRLPPTTAQLTIQSVPPNAVEGKNVLLVAHNIPENLRSFVWYRGTTPVNRHKIAQNVITTNRSLLGPAHSGREAVYPNGSLLLHNVTQKDTGFYTLRTLNTQLETQETQVYLHIYSKSFFVTSGSGGVDFPVHTQYSPLWTDCILYILSPRWGLNT